MSNILKNRFKGKVMIVTGSSRGIGKETAIRAAKEGAKVVVVDLLDDGQKVADQINNEEGEAVFFKVNLANEEEVKSLVNKTVEKFGKIDILINNAGVTGRPTQVHELTKDVFDFVFKTNLYSVFFCCKHVINEFIKQNNGGAIVNTSSIGGVVGMPGVPAYIASKHAINGLTKNMAIDYAKYGIRVNSVNPAPTNTPMQEQGYKMAKEKIQADIESGLITKESATSLMGDKTTNIQHRNAEASEQASSILFLASDDASYITGTVLATDGGWTAF